jgi:hypothetical protein
MEVAPTTSEKFKTPQEELEYLREQVKLREAELMEKNIRMEKQGIVAEKISKYNDVPVSDVLHQNYAVPEKKIGEMVTNLAPEKHDKKMSELFSLMQTKGVKNTLTVLKALKDPHLEDDFHRMLVQYVQTGNTASKSPENIEKSAHMILYEVILPEEQDGKQKTLVETVSAMQQFLSGMMSVKSSKSDDSYFTIEIANANGSEQFVMYVSVPISKRDLFEKQITAIFHNVKLTHEPNDYNIFNEDGVSLGAYAVASHNAIFPLKTSDEFEHDPLNIVLNSFSKIKKDGEGAGLQFVIRPREDFHQNQYKYALKRIEKGEKVKEAIKPDSFVAGFGGALKNIFMPIEEKKKDDKKDEDKNTSADAEKIEGIKKKVSEAVLSVNIRLAVSAGQKDDVEKTLREIESAFNQFDKQGLNGITWKHPEKSALSKLFRDFSFRLFSEEIDFPLNLKEIATMIHVPTTSYAISPQLKKADALSAPAPQDMPTVGTMIGVNTYRGVDIVVRMSPEDRLRHLYVIGQTGTGKSVFLKNMVIQDMLAGEGVCYIDPHGSDILDILANVPKERIDDVIYFDPSYVERPMALNMLEYDRAHPEQKTFVVNELFSIFQKLYGSVPESMGPMFEQYFRNATMLVIEDPETGCTLLDVSRVMADKAYRQLKLSRCKNPVVVQFWTEVAEKAGGEASLANIVPYITSKFDVFLANDIMRPIVAQEKSSFNFRDIMDNKKILLVNLSKGRLGDINANLIGLILVGKILMSALSRVDQGSSSLPPFYLYIDEFQNITTNSISQILSEARKYKLSLNVAHQFIAQLDEGIRDAVFGNVGSIVSFRISAEDAEYLEKQFTPVFSVNDLMNINNLNACVKLLLNGRPAKPFNIKEDFPPRGNPTMIDSLKHLSYLKYGGDREEIEGEILNKYKKS